MGSMLPSEQSVLPDVIDYIFASAVCLQNLGPARMHHVF